MAETQQQAVSMRQPWENFMAILKRIRPMVVDATHAQKFRNMPVDEQRIAQAALMAANSSLLYLAQVLDGQSVVEIEDDVTLVLRGAADMMDNRKPAVVRMFCNNGLAEPERPA